MRLVGIELKNFRSIGSEPVLINPLKKCNILIGQNNVGKSNVCKAIQLISEITGSATKGTSFTDLDKHNREGSTPFMFKLWFKLDLNNDVELTTSNLISSDLVWFEFQIQSSNSRTFSNNIFAENFSEFRKANEILKLLGGEYFTQIVLPNIIRKKFLEKSQTIYNGLSPIIPSVYLIPEFRQIRIGDEYKHDGSGLIKLLERYQSPAIGKDNDRIKFEKVQEFTRMLLHLPNAQLDISKEDSVLIIKNGDLRLPISHYGTGVHELIILVTAVLSINNSICCIEEPEIHLHPRLQRELINFLIENTDNQYIISSHSPALINIGETNNDVQIFHLRLSEGITNGGPVLSEKECLSALQDLGINASDLLQSNCILWVEGPSDRFYVKRWLDLLAPDLKEGQDFLFMFFRELPRISIKRDSPETDLIDALKINQNMILIMDSDKKSKNDTSEKDKIKVLMKENCESSGGVCWITQGKEIENYLPNRVIIAACKELRGKDIEITCSPYVDFDSAVDKQLRKAGLTALDYSHFKKDYSKKFAEHFLLSDFTDDLRDEVSRIASKIREWSN